MSAIIENQWFTAPSSLWPYIPCPHCSGGGRTIYHMGEPCPRIKEIEYHRDGSIKRVVYREPT